MSTQNKSTQFRPPKEMINNSCKGKDLKKKWGRGGSADLIKDEAMTLEVIKNIYKFFKDNPESFKPNDLEKDGGPDEGTINWLLHGGSAAKKWCERLLIEHEEDFNYNSSVIKVDETLGLVLGWAIICKEAGKEYYDVQGDHIPEASMLKASVEFMKSQRTVGDMHETVEGGQVVFAFPMTEEIAKAFDIVTKTTGLMIGIKPENQKTLEKFKNGEYNGFSIGGKRVKDEPQGD